MAYDPRNWELLAGALNTENFGGIHTFNRVQLIEDSFSLASTNYITFDHFFEIIKYLRAENDFMPWQAVIRKIKLMYNYFQKGHHEKFEVS